MKVNSVNGIVPLNSSVSSYVVDGSEDVVGLIGITDGSISVEWTKDRNLIHTTGSFELNNNVSRKVCAGTVNEFFIVNGMIKEKNDEGIPYNATIAAWDALNKQICNVSNPVSDQDAVTLNYLSNAFKTVQLANGYQKLQNGIILQWGSVTPSRANTLTTFSFLNTFPQACLNLSVTTISDKSAFYGSWGYVINNAFAAAACTKPNIRINWIAIGS